MRKLIHLCASGALVLGLGACTGDDTDDGTSTSVGTTTVTDTSPTTSDGTTTDATTTDATTTDATTTDATTTDATTSAGSSGGGSTGGGSEDPNYPHWDGTGACPGDTVGPYTFNDPNDGTGVCTPPCDGMGISATCPDPGSGNAVPFCGFNPDSSADTCTMDTDCTTTDETCSSQGACLLPSSHCFLVCDDGQGNTFTCPDSMICTGAGICEYDG